MIRILLILFLFSCNKGYPQSGILGVDVSDGLPANPSLLTWTKVHEERYLNLMDENHVHYTSNFSSSTSNLSALSGSAPSISGGNLVITGSIKYQSTSTSVASWNATELTIASMGSAGSSNKLGPCFIKDATHYIAAVYDKVTGYLQIIQDDAVLYQLPYTINTTGCKIFLIISGNSISVWYQESGGDVTLGFSYTSTIDLKAIDITQYKYGVYCLQTGGSTTHNISSLRGAASGGVSLFNNKIVRNADGSDYILAGKLLMTADVTNASSLTYPYIEVNSVLLSVDTATWAVEIVGRFYFDRSSKRLGGQDLHVIWNGSQWLITYVPIDDSPSLEGDDYYFFLNYADIFTEVVVAEADLTHIGFSTGTNYDVSTRIIGGVFKSAVTTYPHIAKLFSGSDLDAMSPVATLSTTNEWECGFWARYRGTWYLSYSGFGDTKQIVLGYPAMDSIGMMNLPFVANPALIPGYDWYCKQTNGKTTYYMIGFDTQLFSANISTFGTIEFAWTLGRFVVWKATEQKNAYEF